MILSSPARLALNQWAFGGSWRAGAESGKLETVPGKIVFRFHSRDLHMVLGPTPVRFKVKLNNAAPATITDPIPPPMAQARSASRACIGFIWQKVPIKDATYEIEFLDPSVEVFSFTFG